MPPPKSCSDMPLPNTQITPAGNSKWLRRRTRCHFWHWYWPHHAKLTGLLPYRAAYSAQRVGSRVGQPTASSIWVVQRNREVRAFGQKSSLHGEQLDTWWNQTFARNLRKPISNNYISSKDAPFHNEHFFAFFWDFFHVFCKNAQKCALFAAIFTHPQYWPKNKDRKVKGNSENSWKEFPWVISDWWIVKW